MTKRTIFSVMIPNIMLVLSLSHGTAEEKRPLQVYVLAGQSNMQGHARVETIDYLGDDPATSGWLSRMVDSSGQPRVCERVWISYLTGARDRLGEGFGKLTTGYGARQVPNEDGGKIGPELTFGLTVEKATRAPILLIKTAWGGKSLHTDFRPPSAGPYVFQPMHLENMRKQGQDIEQVRAEKKEKTGICYGLMISHVRRVLKDINRVCPEYEPEHGFEMAGFVWFQGWNDMVDRNTYPNRREPGGYDLYSELLAHFIRDIRRDLNAPEMPFVIGVMGVGGVRNQPEYFREAMTAPAKLPEFRGNVVAVPTAPFWDAELASIEKKQGRIGKIRYYLRKGDVPGDVVSRNYPVAYELRKEFWDSPKDQRVMSKAEQQDYLTEYRRRVISVEEETRWKRGASNAGYHYLGSAKTMALIGQAFAEANLMLRK